MTTARRRLRVAHVTLGLDLGGQEKLLVEFARHADRRRFELVFVSLGGRGVLAGDLEALGWPVVALDAPTGLRPSLVLQLARAFCRWAVDVVHTHDTRPHIFATPAAVLAGVRRVIHTRHYGLAQRLSRRQRWAVSALALLTDRFVCVSRDSARLAIAQGVSPRKVMCIHNGIDVDRFHPGDNPDGPAVTVARLSPEKELGTLLHATVLVLRDDPAFRLEIAGDGVCMAELRQTAEKLGVAHAVTFLGQVRDVPGLLARAGLFVLPSLAEGISLTLLEAMASGLAVATTRVGGNPEVVQDGVTGLLVPPADPPALAAALLRLRCDAKLRQSLGDAGRRRVEQHFAVKTMVTAYERLYEGPCADR
jgi:glycosyltransferase involved in cell wall biosynthesis